MKRLIFICSVILLITLGTLSLMRCAGPVDPDNTVSVNTKFYITETYEAKYSRVNGYIMYNNIKLPATNGSTGYYYKKYNLQSGDVIDVNVNITTKYFYNGVQLFTSDINLDNYLK